MALSDVSPDIANYEVGIVHNDVANRGWMCRGPRKGCCFLRFQMACIARWGCEDCLEFYDDKETVREVFTRMLRGDT